MDYSRRAALLAIGSMCLIGILVTIALKLHLYSFTWWYDDIVHTFAGTVICYFYFVFRRFFSFFEQKIGLLISVIIFALIVGIGWEIFEAVVHEVGGGLEGYWTDTIADVTEDVFGAVVAYFIITTKK